MGRGWGWALGKQGKYIEVGNENKGWEITKVKQPLALFAIAIRENQHVHYVSRSEIVVDRVGLRGWVVLQKWVIRLTSHRCLNSTAKLLWLNEIRWSIKRLLKIVMTYIQDSYVGLDTCENVWKEFNASNKFEGKKSLFNWRFSSRSGRRKHFHLLWHELQ